MFAWTILSVIFLAQVQREEIPATHEIVYRVSEGKTCNLSWTLAQTELNRTVAQLRTDCGASLERVLSMSDQIIDRIQKTEPARFRALNTLFIGGLSALPEMRSRLVLLATRSGEWDPVGGKPRSSGPQARMEAFVKRNAQRSGFLKGWEEMFLRHGVLIEVAGVEDTRVEKAGSLPFFDELRRSGVGANDRVPSTCLLWIRLIHEQKGNQKP